MIHISRLTTPASTTEILEHVILPDPRLRDLFASQLADVMMNRPETVLVLEARSDENGLLGFIIADLGFGQVTNLRQAWVSPKASWELAKELQLRLMFWSVSHNRSQIEIRSQRSAEALYKRFGFIELAKILVQEIPPEFTQRLLEGVREKEMVNE